MVRNKWLAYQELKELKERVNDEPPRDMYRFGESFPTLDWMLDNWVVVVTVSESVE